LSKARTYDLIIIGAGPAALSAAIYAARYALDFIIIGGIPGGNMALSYDIDNYPGYPHTTGGELTKKMVHQLETIGQEILIDSIKQINGEAGNFELLTSVGETYFGRNILLAIGAEKNKLGIPGEKELCGKGVSYCATCDGFFFKGLTVAVIGGGDAAVEAAVFLSDVAKKVYIIHRRNEFRADPDWQKRLNKAPNVEMVLETNVLEILGKEKVSGLRLDKDEQVLDLDGVFIEIGETPSSILFEQLGLKRDEGGYVIVDEGMRTSSPGIWAAGDSTTGSNKFRQIITAASEGAIAANTIYTKIRESK
jgi:thioredoxin reductase (NADPH)